VEALNEALKKGCPEIFNTDQGSQFTSQEFVALLQSRGIKVSMDGKGSYTDNLFVERLWRTLTYEEVYLKAYPGASVARAEIAKYIRYYNTEKPHQSLGYKAPAEVYYDNTVEEAKERMLESVSSRTPASTIERVAVSHLNSE
jgi:putative transposase